MMTQTLGGVYTPLTVKHLALRAHAAMVTLGIEARKVEVIAGFMALCTTGNP
jgi:hypothetical protein